MFTLREDTESAHSHAHVSRGDGWKVQKEESWRGDGRREINVRKETDWPNGESGGSEREKKEHGVEKSQFGGLTCEIAAPLYCKDSGLQKSCTSRSARADGFMAFMFCGCQTRGERSKDIHTNKQTNKNNYL